MTKINHLRIAIAVFTVIILLGFFSVRSVYAAAQLSLSPGLLTIAGGSSAAVSISINTETTSVMGSDAVLSFPTDDIDVTSVANGGFFSNFNYAIDPSGRLEIHGYFSNQYDSRSGSGTLATFSIRAKKNSGTGTVSFVCGGTGTVVLDANGQNIIQCGSLNSLALTYSGGTVQPSPTPTPTPMPTPTPTPQPTATPAPQTSGNAAPTCTGLSASPNQGNKMLWVTLTCSGSDTDNDINAAEFSFGNGNVKLVEKNVGLSGSISTLFAYADAGTYTASCRVRDNNQRFSTTPDPCKKTIQVFSSTSGTGLKRGTNNREILAAANVPQTVQLTPYVTPTPAPLPKDEFPEKVKSVKRSWLPAALGIAIVLVLLCVGGYVMWKLRKSTPNLPPQPPPQPPLPTPPT